MRPGFGALRRDLHKFLVELHTLHAFRLVNDERRPAVYPFDEISAEGIPHVDRFSEDTGWTAVERPKAAGHDSLVIEEGSFVEHLLQRLRHCEVVAIFRFELGLVGLVLDEVLAGHPDIKIAVDRKTDELAIPLGDFEHGWRNRVRIDLLEHFAGAPLIVGEHKGREEGDITLIDAHEIVVCVILRDTYRSLREDLGWLKNLEIDLDSGGFFELRNFFHERARIGIIPKQHIDGLGGNH